MAIQNRIVIQDVKMSIKYYLHKLFGRLFDVPVIPVGKTVGYSLIKSERVDSVVGEKARVYPPFFLHESSTL